MYVKVTGDSENQRVLVMGEPLARQEQDDYYLLPGRLVRALKPDDLPVGIRFKLAGALPSGYGFYREDTVIFRRINETSTLWIDVTSCYVVSEWDGLFPLEATVLARKKTLEQHEKFQFVVCETSEHLMKIRYEFSWSTEEELDLEKALEAVCDTVFEVEARGNARLWPGYGNG
ncbi:hypothetical protein [Brevibacillus sp. NRS-1366]|uniref:hypothetical protein n=1 Tax=Brevibacillus sp. NRS-1366 TaxID=3233899 RepID=UPI003D1A9733